MDADEREIFNYLKTWGAQFIGAKEICRRAATKRRFHNDPDWAKPMLISMTNRGILENDNRGHYRIKPIKKKKAEEPQAVSNSEETLPADGGEAETHAAGLAPDEYYDQL